MGFRPDQTLGSINQQVNQKSEHGQTANSLPIKLNINSDRSGIGVINKKPKTLPSGKSSTLGGDDDCGCGQDNHRILSSFIDLQQDRYDEVKYKRLISKAISTCQKLDKQRLKTNNQTRKHDEEEEE
ncbi:hypothetical protein PPACK8108_LOCUS8456 [Phakopsora pachyrhizi]|uniref:Uncharacterized protein n=1 Tax=Phakopsora pachyrhizi TaxID=170000 RepID=A0AAV0AXZ0_PHAPC|nr:hypothetical protein PPACK8108_LOCUS8456 [Phakopsora pachyrhizi]